jgi:hypothetical protein
VIHAQRFRRSGFAYVALTLMATRAGFSLRIAATMAASTTLTKLSAF